MDIADSLEHSAPGLLSKLQTAIHATDFTARTESNYRHWIGRYLFFHDLENPAELDERNVQEFLSYLATSLKVSPAKQNQALRALDFLYAKVLNKPLRNISGFVKAKPPVHLKLLSGKQLTKANRKRPTAGETAVEA